MPPPKHTHTPDNISLTIIIISPAGITSRQIIGGGEGGREQCPPDNISLTLLIISKAAITSRQLIGIILVNLDWRSIQNVLTVLIAEDLSLKKLIDATLSPWAFQEIQRGI